MSIALATPRHVFGFKSNVSTNLWYLDEQTIVYPSGSNCILYNIDQRTQRFIPCTENGSGITAIAVSPNRRYVAVAEKSEKPTITIFDLHSLRKRKVLSSPECQSMEFVSIAFSPDSKYLIAQGGRPDWTLLYWTWEKAKVLAFTKSTNQQNSPVYQVSYFRAEITLQSPQVSEILSEFWVKNYNQLTLLFCIYNYLQQKSFFRTSFHCLFSRY